MPHADHYRNIAAKVEVVVSDESVFYKVTNLHCANMIRDA